MNLWSDIVPRVFVIIQSTSYRLNKRTETLHSDSDCQTRLGILNHCDLKNCGSLKTGHNHNVWNKLNFFLQQSENVMRFLDSPWANCSMASLNYWKNCLLKVARNLINPLASPIRFELELHVKRIHPIDFWPHSCDCEGQQLLAVPERLLYLQFLLFLIENFIFINIPQWERL